MKLLYKGQKFIDETFPDYLMRMAFWNGFKSLNTFSKTLKEIYRVLYVNPDKNEISKETLSTFNVSQENLGWLECKFALEKILKRNFPLDEINLPRQPVGNKLYRVNVCHACWKESPYVRFYWRFGSYNVCHVHEIRLVAVHMTAYHLDLEGLKFASSSLVRFSLNGDAAIRKFLQIKQNTGCSLKDFYTEMDNFADESKLWPEVVLFLKDCFLISFKFKSVNELLVADVLCGLDPLVRLEMVADMLVVKSNANEKLVKIVLLIFLSKRPFYKHRVRNFYSWARAQAYSLSPLLEAYVFGVYTNLFNQQSRFRKEIICPIYFSNFSYAMISQFIIDSGVLSHKELDRVRTGVKWNSDGYLNSSDSTVYNQYKHSIKVLDENIFDRDPLPRE